MSQFGYRPCSRRTVTGYSTLLWRAGFWPSFLPTKRYECCCRTSTFRSTARRLPHGHRRKSFVAKDGSDEPPSPGRNGERDFHREPRSNETHASSTDPEARLSRKGNKEAKLAYTG